MSKVFGTASAAVADIEDGASLAVGGFGACGIRDLLTTPSTRPEQRTSIAGTTDEGLQQPARPTTEVIDNGWFRTGDLTGVDEDGFHYIVDRAKDLIARGGFNVYPREIEEVLVTHESVSLAAVVGLPDERHGEEVKISVILAPAAQVTEDELIARSKAQMASYKYPRRIEFVAAFPMTATGKILDERELVRFEAAL